MTTNAGLGYAALWVGAALAVSQILQSFGVTFNRGTVSLPRRRRTAALSIITCCLPLLLMKRAMPHVSFARLWLCALCYCILEVRNALALHSTTWEAEGKLMRRIRDGTIRLVRTRWLMSCTWTRWERRHKALPGSRL